MSCGDFLRQIVCVWPVFVCCCVCVFYWWLFVIVVYLCLFVCDLQRCGASSLLFNWAIWASLYDLLMPQRFEVMLFGLQSGTLAVDVAISLSIKSVNGGCR